LPSSWPTPTCRPALCRFRPNIPRREISRRTDPHSISCNNFSSKLRAVKDNPAGALGTPADHLAFFLDQGRAADRAMLVDTLFCSWLIRRCLWPGDVARIDLHGALKILELILHRDANGLSRIGRAMPMGTNEGACVAVQQRDAAGLSHFGLGHATACVELDVNDHGTGFSQVSCLVRVGGMGQITGAGCITRGERSCCGWFWMIL